MQVGIERFESREEEKEGKSTMHTGKLLFRMILPIHVPLNPWKIDEHLWNWVRRSTRPDRNLN